MEDFYFIFGVIHFCISIGPVLFLALLFIKRVLFRRILEGKENSVDVKKYEIMHTITLFFTFLVGIIEVAAFLAGAYLFYFEF